MSETARRRRIARGAGRLATRRRNRRRSAQPPRARARCRRWARLDDAWRRASPARSGGGRGGAAPRGGDRSARSRRALPSRQPVARTGPFRGGDRIVRARARSRPRPSELAQQLRARARRGGRGRHAHRLYRRILEARPDHRQALRNLAHSLCSRAPIRGGRRALCALSASCIRKATPACGSIRASASTPAATTSAAEASFRRALALAPGDAVAQTNLASVLIDRGDFAAAEAPLSRRRRRPIRQFLYAAALLAYCRQHLCAWDGLDALHARRRARHRAGRERAGQCFRRAVGPDVGGQSAARRAPLGAKPRTARACRRAAPRARSSALRLGYVSSDFRTHAVAFLATEVWERHDRARFETSAYSIAPPEDSPLGHPHRRRVLPLHRLQRRGRPTIPRSGSATTASTS